LAGLPCPFYYDRGGLVREGVSMKNRLKHWRHQLEFNKKEMAEFLGVNYQQYVNWENQRNQPDVTRFYNLWNKIKNRINGINMQDLIDPE